MSSRGGLAAALNEIAIDGQVAIEIEEQRVNVNEAVAAACELLGLDPFYVANEGRLVAVVPEADAARALAIMQSHPLGRGATYVGRVLDDKTSAGTVMLHGRFGGRRLLDLLSGEQLPRIC